MNVLIVEDEVNACEYLTRVLNDLRPSYQIIEHLDSVQETINWLKSKPHPDLIMLDVQLSDGISFEIFNHVHIGSPIIFTTAYDQFALQAFKVNSIDYLLKPINKEELESSLIKFETRNEQSQHDPKLNSIFENLSSGKKNRCLVKKGKHFEFINVSEIAFIHSDDSLSFLYSTEGKKHLYAKTIQVLEKELDPKSFFQINRKQIININSIKKIHPFLNQRLKIELHTPTDIDFIVSRGKMAAFKQWVDS